MTTTPTGDTMSMSTTVPGTDRFLDRSGSPDQRAYRAPTPTREGQPAQLIALGGGQQPRWRGSRDLLTSIEDQQTPGNTGLIWLSLSPPFRSPSGRAAVLDTDFPGMLRVWSMRLSARPDPLNRCFRTLMVALSRLTPMTWKGQQTAFDESAHAQYPYVRVVFGLDDPPVCPIAVQLAVEDPLLVGVPLEPLG